MEGRFDYEKVIKMLHKFAKSTARKHRDEVISDALLLIYEKESEFKEGRKIKPWIRKCFNKAKNEYFKRIKSYEISVGGLEDLQYVEENGYNEEV